MIASVNETVRRISGAGGPPVRLPRPGHILPSLRDAAVACRAERAWEGSRTAPAAPVPGAGHTGTHPRDERHLRAGPAKRPPDDRLQPGAASDHHPVGERAEEDRQRRLRHGGAGKRPRRLPPRPSVRLGRGPGKVARRCAAGEILARPRHAGMGGVSRERSLPDSHPATVVQLGRLELARPRRPLPRLARSSCGSSTLRSRRASPSPWRLA